MELDPKIAYHRYAMNRLTDDEDEPQVEDAEDQHESRLLDIFDRLAEMSPDRIAGKPDRGGSPKPGNEMKKGDNTKGDGYAERGSTRKPYSVPSPTKKPSRSREPNN